MQNPNAPIVEDDEEDEEKMDDEKTVSEQWKALMVDNVGSIAEIAEGQATLLSAMQSLKVALDNQKQAFDATVGELRQENKALRDELALTPQGHRASQSVATITDDAVLQANLEKKEKGESGDSFWNFALNGKGN
jgi:hypothetical protein